MTCKVLKVNTIHKINDSAKMNKSAEPTATAHTLVRYQQ